LRIKARGYHGKVQQDRPGNRLLVMTPLLLRWIAALYWIALTVLLLAPDPWGLFGIRHPPAGGWFFGPHFGCFVLLGGLVCCARFPGRPTAWAGALVGYAVAVEFAQALVPTRTVQWQDVTANLAGLACGALIGWAALRVRTDSH